MNAQQGPLICNTVDYITFMWERGLIKHMHKQLLPGSALPLPQEPGTRPPGDEPAQFSLFLHMFFPTLCRHLSRHLLSQDVCGYHAVVIF